MRKREQQNGITVNAIAGTYVVFLSMDINKTVRKNFRGFAIQREDHAENEIIWLRGMKTFEATEPHPASGETFSSLYHPFQSFQWADYSAKPGVTYTYTIHRMYGEPGHLQSKGEVSVQVLTELETGPTHSVFFNRGSVATQEYARKFQDKKPDVVGAAAWEWLSRGLKEALLAFIGRCKNGESIYGAIYELQDNEVLLALKAARQRGVKVAMLYDNMGPGEANVQAITKAGATGFCKGRSNGELMHNKFFIYCDGSGPKEVWTGSTNLTQNGIYGHSNLGHIVDDRQVATSYMDYWKRLKKDPAIDGAYRSANMAACPIPEALEVGTTTIFSPRDTSLDALQWYKSIAGSAQKGLFMTFAFGMHPLFKEIYGIKDNVLRMALMEKANGNPKTREKEEAEIQAIRNFPNVIVSIGNRIPTNAFDRWLKEIDNIDNTLKHIHWIHTKYMIVDPLGDTPIIVSGSANFSKASSDTNDENMLIIKGDKRIADIYFGEYLRLFSHYSFREVVKWALGHNQANGPSNWKPQYLIANDMWMNDYFNDANDKSARCLRRTYFSGDMAE